MTTTSDVFATRRDAGSLTDTERAERAQRAVTAFRKMQPTLSAFARALTKRNDVRVVMDSGSPRTDGKVIYFRPPIALGTDTKHDRAKCELRDRQTLVLKCPACAAREWVMVVMYHEISHIAFQTFRPPTESQRKEIISRAVAEAGGKHAEAIARRIESAPGYVTGSYIGLASLVNEYLPIIVNALEDSRVNREMFRARPGTKVMFEGWARDTFSNGVEQRDHSVIKWCDYPLNAQVIVGLFTKAAGYDYRNWFTPDVADALDDEELTTLINRMDSIRNTSGVYELAFPILVRLRELGFCKNPEDEEDEPQDEPDESNDEEEAGDPGDEGQPSDEQDDQGEDDGDSESESGDSPDGEDPGEPSDPNDGGDDTDDPDGPGDDDRADESTREGEGTPDAEGNKTSDDGSNRGDSQDSGDDSDDDDRGEQEPGDDSDSEPEGGDTDPAEGDDGDSGSSDSSSEGEPSSAELPPSGGAEPAPETTETEEDAEQPVDDPSDGSDEPKEDGTDDADPVDDPSDVPDDDGEEIDTGADDGKGGTRIIREEDAPEPEYGEPSDAQQALKVFGDHEERPTSLAESKDNEAIDIAIIQGLYFEQPSQHVSGVRIHRRDGDLEGADGWGYENLRRFGVSLSEGGVSGDIRVEENILSPCLLRMRVAFADNARAAYQHNLKSGRIRQSVLGRRAWSDDVRLFQKKHLPGKKSYFVVIGIDISGSTTGLNIRLAKRAAMAQAELCDRAGVPFAVYAHTAVHRRDKSGFSLEIYEVKAEKEPWSDKQREALEALGPVSDNLDGHSVEFYRKRLDESQATDKIMLYYTDGKMPAANHDEELEILQRELRICQQKRYTVLGVGIRTDSPIRHGLDTVQVDDDNDMIKVVKHLEKRLVR